MRIPLRREIPYQIRRRYRVCRLPRLAGVGHSEDGWIDQLDYRLGPVVLETAEPSVAPVSLVVGVVRCQPLDACPFPRHTNVAWHFPSPVLASNLLISPKRSSGHYSFRTRVPATNLIQACSHTRNSLLAFKVDRVTSTPERRRGTKSSTPYTQTHLERRRPATPGRNR